MLEPVSSLFNRLIRWLDFPPPKPKKGVSDVYWEFLGDILGELATLSHQEIQIFAQKDFSDDNAIKVLVNQWIYPVFYRLTPDSKQKIIASLDYYLCVDSEKIHWILPSFGIPIRINSPFHFFKLIRETLTNTPLPPTINSSLFHENTHRSFTNTLFGYLKIDPPNFTPPIRKGFILPKNLTLHHKETSLDALKKWASYGTYPNGTQGIPIDAARWIANVDVESIYQLAASRFFNQKNDALGINRITLQFSHPVGEGFFANHPNQLVKTQKVRAFVSRFGFLTHCYPTLR